MSELRETVRGRQLSFLLLICVFAASVWGLARVSAGRVAKPVDGTPSLGALLKPDGTLDLSRGFQGGLNAQGYRMEYTADGAPRFVPAAPATAGWDTQFVNPNGVQRIANVVTVSGTDIYVGGDFTTAGATIINNIARWDGSSWSSLGSGVNGPVYALAFSGGDLYVGGDFTTAGGVPANNIAKWNGGSWSALGSGVSGGSSDYVLSLTVSGSNLYVGGQFTTAGGNPASRIAKWNGSSWSALGSGVPLQVWALAVIGSDLYVGGDFTTAGGAPANYIAKWNGSSWSALGSGVTNQVRGLAVIGSDLYVAGQFTMAGGVPANNIAKWNGSAWSALGGGLTMANGSTTVVGGIVVVGANVYVGGSFDTAGGSPARSVAVWNGSAWAPMGNGLERGGITLSSGFFSMAASGTDVYVAAAITKSGNTEINRIAKWNGSAWSSIGNAGNSPNNYVYALAVIGSNLYVGGEFDFVGGMAANNIARWNGSSWSTLGSGLNFAAYTMAVIGSDLYVGGFFTTAGGNPAGSIARWNGSAWSPLGSGVGNGFAVSLAAGGTNLYVGGTFTTAGGIPANRIARWDGSAWSALGSGMNDTVGALAVIGNDLYAGGAFINAGGVAVNNVAKWNGTTWSALGSGVNNSVNAMAVIGSDLYVGGSYTQAGGNAAGGLAKWNGSTWSAVGGLNGGVRCLLSVGSDLYAGGFFSTTGGNPTTNLAKWNGSAWTVLSTQNSIYDVPATLAFQGTNLFAGGQFTTLGGTISHYFGRQDLCASTVVTNGNDSGAGSLRQIIADACPGSTITFQAGVTTVTLTTAELLINKNLTINGGTGVTVTRQSGSPNFRIFNITSGTVSLNNLSVTNGSLVDGAGGGIQNLGTLAMTDCTLSGNQAIGDSQAGGLQNSGLATLTRCTISGNTSPQAGGIENDGVLTMTNCTVSGNVATSFGGGLVIFGPTTTLTNCTFSGNQSALDSGGIGSGGALTLTNCTIANNHALNGGSGMIVDAGTVLLNTIVANNTGSSNIEGTMNAAGSFNNILSPGNAAGLTNGVNGNQVGVTFAGLGTLGNYGGTTQTLPLLPGSPAINAGTASGAPATDQRGIARVGNVDVGAYESRGFTLATGGGNNQSAVTNTAFASPLGVTVTSANGEPVNGGRVMFTPPGSGPGCTLATNPATITGGAASSTATANAVIGGPYNVVAAANGATAINFSLTNLNSAPSFTPAAALSRQQGSPAGAAVTIGTVADAQTAAGSLTVTQIAGGTATGINVTGITNTGGTITAVVTADCNAVAGTVRLQVSDGDLTGTGDLQVNINANTVPTLAYDNASVNAGNATTNSPTAATDNGNINSFAIQSQGGYTGTISVNASGVVSISNAAPDGTHTITIRATDNCGAITDAQFTLMVGCVTALTVNNTGDGADFAPGNGVCETAAGNGVCTLRAAIQEANALSACSPFIITITATGTITLTSALPDIAHPSLTINGPGANQLTVSGNNAARVVQIGAGNYNVTLSGLTVANGRTGFISGTPNGGAGLRNNGTGAVSIVNVVFAGNQAVNEAGGAIQQNSSGTLNINGSVLINNVAGTGGGLHTTAGTVNMTNCTVSGNTANYGAGLYNAFVNSGAQLNLTNCTITGNTANAGGSGGGLRTSVGLVTRLKNTIVAGNNGTNPDVEGAFTSQGNNLIGNTTGGTGFGGADLLNVNALLGTLGNYGGTTDTVPLLPGSPAINAGTATGAPATDQRGIARVGNVDIGAFESQGFTLAVSGGNNQSAVTGTAFANPLALTISSAFNEPVNGGRVTFTPPASGASATVAGNPATIAGGNAVSGTVTANSVVGPYNVAATANGATSVDFSLTNLNTAPMFTPAAAISRQQGSPAGAPVTVGTVSDAQTAAGSLIVTQIAGGTATGITVSGITNTNGTITAVVTAGCNAVAGTVRLQVSDGDLTGTGDLTVNVTTNTAPGLSYPISGVALNSATTITPTTTTDNGSITGYQIVSVTPPLTVAPTVNASGVVSVTNAAPFGLHTVTVRATDNCGATTEVQFTLNVGCGSLTVTPATLINGLTFVPYSSTLSATGGSGTYTFSLVSGSLPAGLTLSGNTISGTPNTAGASTFTIRATDDNGCFGEQTYTLLIGSTGLKYYPLARPVRLLDTRPGLSPNACFQPNAPIPGNTARLQPARGVCEGLTIPANATTITGNITTVQSGGGFLTVYPSDAPQPLVANSNYQPNEILNNAFTVGVGAKDGAVKIFVTSTTDVVIDVTGYYAPPEAGGLYFHPLPRPVRLLETRAGFTGCFAPGQPLPGGANTPQLGTGNCQGLTIPPDALALVGNATTVNPVGEGYLTLYPANAAQPLVASSNYAAGQVVNGPFTVGLSPSGQFNIFTLRTTDLVVDITGYYSAQANDANGQGLLFTSLGSPLRLLDTRAGQQGCYTPEAAMIGGTVYTQETQSPCTNLTPTARALIGNATVVNTTGEGYLTFWPADATQPLVATSNYVAGQVFNRYFTVGLSGSVSFKRFASRTTDLVVDISGFFAP